MALTILGLKPTTKVLAPRSVADVIVSIRALAVCIDLGRTRHVKNDKFRILTFNLF